MARIRAQLGGRTGITLPPNSATLVVGDVVVDQATGQARRGEEVLGLTPDRVPSAVTYLARHRGQALTRAQIVEAVWGYTPDLESEKAVNVHIRRLREKSGD